MTARSLAAGMAGLAALGATTAGVMFGVVSASPAAAQVQNVAFDVPLAPATDLPTADQLTGVLYSLADPSVPFANKTGLIEGGLGPVQSAMADRALQKAATKGELPLSFSVANIAPAGADAATADTTVSGPKLPARTMNLTFVDQGGWELSQSSATQLLQAASSVS